MSWSCDRRPGGLSWLLPIVLWASGSAQTATASHKPRTVQTAPARTPPARANTAAPSCDDLDSESLAKAIEAELPALLPRVDPTGSVPTARAQDVPIPGLPGVTLANYARDTLVPLLQLAQRGKAALCRALPRQFRLLPLADTTQGHVTAYYHPVVRGSRVPRAPYTHPLYRRPSDPQSQLVTADILAGKLDGQGLELAYVDSVYAALNIHIEGSATIQLVEGGEINITPDGHNGHPYVNPFKLARADHVVPSQDVSSVDPSAPPPLPGQSRAQRFFLSHPEILRSYWAKNAHFVFFKETPLRGSGRFGQLIAGRSVAVDSARIPLGVALWLRSEVAAGLRTSGSNEETLFSPIARLTLAQDTGAAIRGLGRIDLFVGSGADAQLAAARTSRPGALFLIVHKSVPRSRRRSTPTHTAQPTPPAQPQKSASS